MRKYRNLLVLADEVAAGNAGELIRGAKSPMPGVKKNQGIILNSKGTVYLYRIRGLEGSSG
jgi:hypothetical protein